MKLFDAIRSGNGKVLARLLKSGEDPNSTNERTGESALALAGRLGKHRCVQILLERGADPNSNRTILPPLVAAAGKGYARVVAILLSAGAAVDMQDEDGATALIAAAAAGHLGIIDRLIDAGANPRKAPRNGPAAIQAAAEKKNWKIVERLAPLVSATERESIKRMQKAKSARSAIFSQKQIDRFVEAARDNDAKAIKSFLKRGMPVDAITSSGMTALMRAANSGHLPMVRLLVDAGADVSNSGFYGESALSLAIMGGRLNTTEFLYPITTAKDRQRAQRKINFNRMLPQQYPAWQNWQPPDAPRSVRSADPT